MIDLCGCTKLSRRLVVAGVAVCVLVSVSACSKSAPPPKASLVASKIKVGPGDVVTLTGALSTGKAGLAVQLQSGKAGAFAPTGDSVATDGSGSYRFQYNPSAPGVMTVRVEIVDGKTTTDSPAVQITELAASTVSLAAGGTTEFDARKTATLTGQVTPAVAGRHIGIETSPDGHTWLPTPAAAVTAAGGTFKLAVPKQPSGPSVLRVTVAENNTNADATSAPAHMYFADYKAAGAKYEACVAAGNAAADKDNATYIRYNAGNATLAEIMATGANFASALRTEIACFRGYTWPPSVASLASDLAAQSAVISDAYFQASKAVSIDAYTADLTTPELNAASAASGADAAKVRRGLGLPARHG